MTEAVKLTQGIEEYIEAIWRVGGEGQASTKALADHLSVAPASVSGMLKRLAEMELITYRPYGKASLSAKGKKLAANLIRRHRLSERLLTDILGLPWEKAHTEACKFEHLITDEVEQRLISLLGKTDTCPHGNRMDLIVPTGSLQLSRIEAAGWVKVEAIVNESDDLLSYISKLGITPGSKLRIMGKEPFEDGAILVEIKKQACAVSRSVADKIMVSPVTVNRSPRVEQKEGVKK